MQEDHGSQFFALAHQSARATFQLVYSLLRGPGRSCSDLPGNSTGRLVVVQIPPADRSGARTRRVRISFLFSTFLSMIQMNLPVPHQQQGPALSRLRRSSERSEAALCLSKQIQRPRGGVTQGDCSNGQVRYVSYPRAFSTNPALKPF